MAFLKETRRSRENHRLNPITPGYADENLVCDVPNALASFSELRLSTVSDGCFDAHDVILMYDPWLSVCLWLQ